MKKIITLCVGFFAGLAVQAQSDFPLQFTDKDGNIIPDGTELDITEFEVDDLFGDILMPSNVWVKNNGGETVYGGGSYTVKSIDNGWFQTCFPSVCMRQNTVGTYTTGKDAFQPGQLRDMQTEWFPEGEGLCIVTYQLQTFTKLGANYIHNGDGPAITLNFYYGMTGIKEIPNKEMVNGKCFDLRGRRVQGQPSPGVYIMTDGEHTRKVAIK